MWWRGELKGDGLGGGGGEDGEGELDKRIKRELGTSCLLPGQIFLIVFRKALLYDMCVINIRMYFNYSLDSFWRRCVFLFISQIE